MTTILSRDKTGKTTLGNTVIQVPQTESALSIVATNTIEDGENFAEDYWVYGPDGRQKRKWFKKIRDVKGVFWPPKLDDIATLEAKRWKWQQRNAKRLPEWHKICARLCELGNVGGYRDNGPQARGWVQFDYSDYGVSWSWCNRHDEDEKKPEVINQEFVDWYFDHEKRSRTAGRRYWMFREVFLEAVDHNFMKSVPRNDMGRDSALHLNVNGRDYWFTSSRKDFGNFFEVLAFPEDTSVVRIER